jgi:hypothetical protein
MSDRAKLSTSTRKKIETALDRLLDVLDSLDPDPDLEPSIGSNPYGSADQEGDTSDDEPVLGATEAVNHDRAWRLGGTDLEFDGDTVPDADKERDSDSEPWLAGCPFDGGQDLEHEGEDEASLGATHAVNQEQAWRADGWFRGSDLEFDGETAPSADAEPSLGAPEQMHALCCNQQRWTQGRRDDREDEHDGCEPDEDFEMDDAERGIGDDDGMLEQFPGLRGGLGERVLP